PLSLKLPPARIAEIIKLAGIKTIFADHSCEQLLSEVLNLLPDYSIKVYCRQNDSAEKNADKFINYNLNALTAYENSDNNSISEAQYTVYLMFTSGSTGVPKGIPVSSINLDAYVDNIHSLFGFEPGWKYSQTFDLSFDLSVHDIFICWANAGTLSVMASSDVLNPYRYITANKLNVWFSVPALGMVLEKQKLLKPDVFTELKYVFFCGEPLLVTTAKLWQGAASNARVINLYGPTETTIAVTQYELPAETQKLSQLNGVVSIGSIFPGHSILISDEFDSPSNEGELCISGLQVTEGYFENEIATRKAFFKDKEGLRWYRTGDLVTKEGENIFYKGRKDLQIKWNGFRIELEEVNNHIRNIIESPLVYSVFINEEIGGKRPGIYTVVPIQYEERIEEIILNLRKLIPAYMVPQKILGLNEFPTNKNGKADLKGIKEIIIQ
ncbi:MAG: AMP-binding protein, partial [Cyclobacteriaceae bacterium]|nr:AMP-binding protein [Cyclobacteriaceae bacterium]